MSSPASSLVGLAEQISHNAEVLQKLLDSSSSLQSSIKVDDDPKQEVMVENEAIFRARCNLVEASQAILDLALDPWDRLRYTIETNLMNIAAIRVVNYFGIAKLVPMTGSVSFTDLAKVVKVNTPLLERILRYCFTFRLFKESPPGCVAHTALSEVIPEMSPWIRNATSEMFQASFLKMPDALQIWSEPAEPHIRQIPLNLALGNDKSFFENLDTAGAMETFSSAMACLTGKQTLNLQHMVNGFDWAALGEGPVVDLGGGNGHVSVTIAKAFSNLRLIVEDLPSNAEPARSTIPEDLQSRVSFLEHNFFEPQPMIEAKAYFARRIFHDWPDEDCLRIIQQLMPQLKEGKKLFIADQVLPPAGTVSLYEESRFRSSDLVMFATVGGKERSMEDWKRLLARADGWLGIVAYRQPAGSRLAMLEVQYVCNSPRSSPC